MRHHVHWIVIFLSFIGISQACADCHAERLGRWHFGETRTLTWHSSGGSICATELAPASTTEMSNLRIAHRAAHGLAALSGLTGIAYRPQDGFKGQDSFSFSFSGTGSQSRGTTLVKVNVTVD
jgi:hypothetical protein